MKHAVSVSIGSSKRNKQIVINLLGEQVLIERIGTDGDLMKAQQMYQELDGKVDALGVGGGLLGLMVGDRWYAMHSLLPLVANVHNTPVVDGTGLKMTLERRAVLQADQELSPFIKNRTALVMTAVDRWGMAQGAIEAGYRCTVLPWVTFTALFRKKRAYNGKYHCSNHLPPAFQMGISDW